MSFVLCWELFTRSLVDKFSLKARREGGGGRGSGLDTLHLRDIHPGLNAKLARRDVLVKPLWRLVDIVTATATATAVHAAAVAVGEVSKINRKAAAHCHESNYSDKSWGTLHHHQKRQVFGIVCWTRLCAWRHEDEKNSKKIYYKSYILRYIHICKCIIFKVGCTYLA